MIVERWLRDQRRDWRYRDWYAELDGEWYGSRSDGVEPPPTVRAVFPERNVETERAGLIERTDYSGASRYALERRGM